PELSREEIFAHIEKELLVSQRGKSSFPLRTKSNYLMVLLIDMVLLLLVLGGGIGVYLRFRAAEYNLVGKPESIRGLEEALYQELQKKIGKELTEKEAELASTKARLEELQKRMSSYREELQKNLAADLEKRRKELEDRLQKSLEEASASERKRLLAQYEEEKKKLFAMVQQEYAQKEKTYQEQLLREQQELLARASNQQSALETAKRELSSMQSEYEARLRAFQQTNQQTISLLRAQLAGREREEAFRTQVEAVFSTAMRLVREGKYDEARSRLAQIGQLYAQKPADIEISPSKQALDSFFVEALMDYIRLKEGGIVQEISSVSLAKLKTISESLQKGVYDKNTNQFMEEVRILAREVPEVFAFYTQYQDFLARVQTTQIQEELRRADSLYALKDYKAALVAYMALARRYSLTTRREEIFQRMAEAMNQWQQMVAMRVVTNANPVVFTNQIFVTNTVVMTNVPLVSQNGRVVTNWITNEGRVAFQGNEVEAGRLFTNALEVYKKNPSEALSGFVSVIEKHPLTSYVPLALDYIQKIYASKSTGENREELQKKQEEEAKLLFSQAEQAQKQGDYTRALQLYQRLILRCPLSSYVDRSLESLDKVYYRLLASRKKMTEIESTIKGRVMLVEGDILTLSVIKGDSFVVGQQLKIYRRVDITEVEEIARVEVFRANQMIIQAKIQDVFDTVRPGDLVVGE
ncbi:MAG: tetratricopeptide repeat protein, partial [Brevinematales bacterium]